jgi:DNA invertase Pin-like site-specific DNA recombinase
MALIGYARVSTQDQHLHLQQDALKSAGCIKIFTDTISGATQERKGLEEALNFLREGDAGKLIFHIFGALAEFERDIIRERTNAGLTAARARGKKGGRPKSPLSEEKKLQMAKRMYEDKSMSVGDICRGLHIPRSTFYKYVRGYSQSASRHPGSSSLLVMQGGELAEAPGRWSGIEG